MYRCGFPVPEQRISVNLDQERGRTPRPGSQPQITHCIIRPTTVIRMAALGAYLNKTMSFDNSVLEAISMSLLDRFM